MIMNYKHSINGLSKQPQRSCKHGLGLRVSGPNPEGAVPRLRCWLRPSGAGGSRDASQGVHRAASYPAGAEPVDTSLLPRWRDKSEIISSPSFILTEYAASVAVYCTFKDA